ncbi:MAG TPA: hypothetical protein VHV29_09985 [Terriglobales bacterium]|jgi:hypothetical protein|nr:hypothetical protein [Terriglobales bacterium]
MIDDTNNSGPPASPDAGSDPGYAAVLGGALTQAAPAAAAVSPQQAPQQAPQPQAQPPAPAPTGQSRLHSILSAVAVAAGNGLAASAGQRGRQSFGSGLAAGAQKQLDYQFQSASDAYRAAQLTRQDKEYQLHSQEIQNATQKAHDDHMDWLEAHGYDSEDIANDSQSVLNRMSLQSANGGITVPAGTAINPDGKTINVPSDTPATHQAQLQDYNTFAPALFGLPGQPTGAGRMVPPTLYHAYSNMRRGFGIDGKPIPTEQLPQRIAALSAQEQAYDGALPAVKQAFENVKGIYQAQLDAANKNTAQAAGQKAAQVKQSETDVENSPANQKAAADKAAGIKNAEASTPSGQLDTELKRSEIAKNNQALQDARNKAASPANMLVGSMPDGSQVAGTQDELSRAGASGITKLGANDASKTIISRQLIQPNGLFQQVNTELRQLDQKGNIGVVASRWNDFLAGKVGSQPDFQKLRTSMGLLGTALMQAHVGAKGGDAMLEHFKSLADYRISDPATLRSALAAEYSYVKEKAMLPKAPIPAPQVTQ